jgi:hypothetical protein
VFIFFFSRNLPILAILGPSTGNLYRKRTFFEKLRPKNGLFLNEIHEKSWKIGHFWPKNSGFWPSKKLKLKSPSRPTIAHWFPTAAEKKRATFVFFRKKRFFVFKKKSVFCTNFL